MVNRELNALLLAKLGVTRQRLSQRAKALKVYVPMSTEDATYCLAHQEGIALKKYVPRRTFRRVRALLRALGFDPDRPSRKRRSDPRGKAKTRELILAGGIRLPDPILPKGILDDARKMATTAYPMLYVFENSIRHVIAIMMTKEFGANWWNEAAIPDSLRDTVAQREGIEAEAWRSGRAAHAIYYTDTKDLVQIVQGNWPVFSKLFLRPEWFASLVTCMEMARNSVSHMNPLLKRDVEQLRENLNEWWQLIRENAAVLRSAKP